MKRVYQDLEIGKGVVMQWVGPKEPGKYMAYLRFEAGGQYIAAVDGRKMRALYKRLKKYYAKEYRSLL